MLNYLQNSLFLECLPPCFTMILSLLVKELQLSTINETTSSSGELCRHLSNVFNETTSSSGELCRHLSNVFNETTSSSGELCRHVSNMFNETTSSSGEWGRHFFQMYSTPQDYIFFRWKDIISNV